jgi:flagellar protein FlgJ
MMSQIDNSLPLPTAPNRSDSVAPGQTDHAPEKQKLRKACLDFEGYFVGMLLKQMRGNEIKGSLFGQSSEANLYREMLDDNIAKEIGKRGNFGIADMLYREMIVTLERKKA